MNREYEIAILNQFQFVINKRKEDYIIEFASLFASHFSSSNLNSICTEQSNRFKYNETHTSNMLRLSIFCIQLAPNNMLISSNRDQKSKRSPAPSKSSSSFLGSSFLGSSLTTAAAGALEAAAGAAGADEAPIDPTFPRPAAITWKINNIY